jgi:O-antigen/teichoic acid export membrane protein
LIDQTPSLARRYAAKLGGNIFGMLFNFINISLIPRSLGPTNYGNFEFLLSFFQQIIGFIDTGTSTAFYKKLSQRNADLGLIRTYAIFVVLVAAVLVLGIWMSWVLGLKGTIWPNQDWQYILLASAVCYIMWVQEVVRKIIDSYGCTIRGELVFLGSRLMGMLVIVILFLGAWLNLTTLFLKEIVFYLVVTTTLSWIVIKHWRIHLYPSVHATSSRLVVSEMWTYCSPLLIYALVGLITGLADRWLLQRYSGAEEQGFYSLALRVAGISFVFTAAMTQLIMRDYSIAHDKGDLAELKRLFKRYVPMLFTLASYFAAFVSVHADTVIWILGGSSFAAASSVMMLMAWLPIHQTYGQMNGALMFATDKTRLYRNIGVTTMVTGVIFTFSLLAPRDSGGLAAGSMGLAIKMVFIQAIAVNIQLWFNLQYIGLKFKFFLLHQIGVISIFMLMAWISTFLASMIEIGRLGSFFLAGTIYTILIAIAIYFIPVMVSSDREEISLIFKKIKLKIKKFQMNS